MTDSARPRMRLAIPRERRSGERRVAASPDTVRKFRDLGLTVVVETGAGAGAHLPDEAFRAAGAEIAPDMAAVCAGADIVLKVQRPLPEEVGLLQPGTTLVALLAPHDDRPLIDSLAERGLTSFALELMPRITRAQSMDVLSSQANLAGYRAALEAAAHFGRAMPMMMTAAGTVAPARVFVLGTGVAGLQAIATARRLGAVVAATDVRPSTKEQVESLGANFVMVEAPEVEQAETSGGYAREMSAEYRERQAALVAETLKKQDIAICTALIPGQPAPRLISAEMVRSMKPGSVIVDLAAERGGNCALSRPGEVTEEEGVTIIAHTNWPSLVAADASALYARNLLNFLTPMIDRDRGALAIDWEDEIVRGTLLTRDGRIVHPNFGAAVSEPVEGDS